MENISYLGIAGNKCGRGPAPSPPAWSAVTQTVQLAPQSAAGPQVRGKKGLGHEPEHPSGCTGICRATCRGFLSPVILPSWGLRSNTDLPARVGHGSESRRRRRKRKEVDPHCSLSSLCNQAAPGISPFMSGSTSASIPYFVHLGEKLILIFIFFLRMKARQGAIVLPRFQKMS